MRSFTVKVLGLPVFSVDVEEYAYVSEEDVDSSAVGGGSAHNFQLADEWVDERYLPWEDEGKAFGFQAGGAL